MKFIVFGVDKMKRFVFISLFCLLLVGCGSNSVMEEPSTEVVDVNEVTVSENSVSSNTLPVVLTPELNSDVSITVNALDGYEMINSVLLHDADESIETMAVLVRSQGDIESDGTTLATNDYKEECITIAYVKEDSESYVKDNILYTSTVGYYKTYMADESDDILSRLKECFTTTKVESPIVPLHLGTKTLELQHNLIDYSTTYSDELPSMDSNVVTAYTQLDCGDYIMITYSYSDAVLFNSSIPFVEDVILTGNDIVDLDESVVQTYVSSIDLFNSNYENLEISLGEFLPNLTLTE